MWKEQRKPAAEDKTFVRNCLKLFLPVYGEICLAFVAAMDVGKLLVYHLTRASRLNGHVKLGAANKLTIIRYPQPLFWQKQLVSLLAI